MSKQLRFYATVQDELEFLNFVSSLPNSFCFKDGSENKHYSSFIIPWTRIEAANKFEKNFLFKGNKESIRTYIKEHYLHVYDEETMSYQKTDEKIYWLDEDAPVVEFTRSFFRNDGKLVQGRIYANFYFVENLEFVYKGDDLLQFYEILAKWLRKNYKKLKDVDGYFGKEALQWYQEGGDLFPPP